jgi:hypothetical protein
VIKNITRRKRDISKEEIKRKEKEKSELFLKQIIYIVFKI